MSRQLGIVEYRQFHFPIFLFFVVYLDCAVRLTPTTCSRRATIFDPHIADSQHSFAALRRLRDFYDDRHPEQS